MRRPLLVLLALLPLHTSAQMRVTNPRPLPMLPSRVADKLDSAYRATQYQPAEKLREYGACLPFEALPTHDGTRIYAVHGFRFPEQYAYTEYDTAGRIINFRVAFACEVNEISVHPHSRAICTALFPERPCPDSAHYWSHPSGIDSIATRDQVVSLIQYGPREFFAYWPSTIPIELLDPAAVRAWHDSIRADSAEARKRSNARLRRDLYLSALAGGLLANHWWKLDTDPGGYTPRWDKSSALHFASGYALEELGHVMSVGPRTRIAAVCATGWLFEVTQGFVDHRDAALACAGAASSALVRYLGERVRRR